MSIRSFFAKTFEHLFGQPLNKAPATQVKRRKLKPYARKNGHWVKWQLQGYAGDGMVVVKVPDNMPMETAQKSIRSYLALHFGSSGQFITRSFATARTVHVRPKSA